VCIDTEVLPSELAGLLYDSGFLNRLPAGIDPCGERGEFHTFVARAPGFRAAVPHEVGETVIREGRFAYCDLLSAEDMG
jgi:diphthamide synthase (EF-2-diphthine--ammonia ligase)